eukprot:GFUD01059221.1.p1 GENE.GFUD01059221.1~~GFUD01059221.1.p1  ORF type:complete len:121 (-),score=41.49 GFUD01059221.1:46-375(-)
MLSIQRKGSGHWERGKVKTLKSIEEMGVKVSSDHSDISAEETGDNNVAMDCLTVPGTNCNSSQQTRTPRRQNSLPARRGSNSSRRGSSSSPRRSSKQEFYQFLDMAIAQ